MSKAIINILMIHGFTKNEAEELCNELCNEIQTMIEDEIDSHVESYHCDNYEPF